jgi:copper(I)-binding protein
MMKISMIIVAPLALLALAGCGDNPKNTTKASVSTNGVTASVVISDPWCRPSPNGAKVGACYATIKANTSNRLTGAATPLATDVEIHDMVMEGGVMKMIALPDGMPLVADEKLELAPGGKHLMLMGLTGPLSEGTAVPLTFTFTETPAMTVEAPVRQPKS